MDKVRHAPSQIHTHLNEDAEISEEENNSISIEDATTDTESTPSKESMMEIEMEI